MGHKAYQRLEDFLAWLFTKAIEVVCAGLARRRERRRLTIQRQALVGSLLRGGAIR